MSRPLRITFIGRYTEGATGVVRSIYMGLKELGHEIQEIDVGQRPGLIAPPVKRGGHGPNYVRVNAIRAELSKFKPHAIILCGGGLTFRPVHMVAVKRYCPVVGITLSDPDVFPTVSRYCRWFTWHTTNSVAALRRYQQLGVKNTLLMPFGVDSRFFVPRPVDPLFACDVAVIGHAHEGRLPLARKLADHFNVLFHGRNWPFNTIGPVHGEDWFRAAYSAKFLVNFPTTRAGYKNVKVGVFEATATGRLLFTEYFDEMRRYFAYDTEIVGYADDDDLIRKIRYYLDHPEEAERIARAGQERCRREHMWTHRLSELLGRIAAAPAPKARWPLPELPEPPGPKG